MSARDAKGRFRKADQYGKPAYEQELERLRRDPAAFAKWSGWPQIEPWQAQELEKLVHPPMGAGNPAIVLMPKPPFDWREARARTDNAAQTIAESLLAPNALYEAILAAQPPRRPWWRRLGEWLRGRS